MLRILVEKQLPLDLRHWLQAAADQYPAKVIAAGTVERVLEYMVDRFRAWYEEEGIAAEVFMAVSARKPSNPLDIDRRVQAVHAFTRLPEAAALAAANKRVSNILGKLQPGHQFGSVDHALLLEPAEQALAQQLEQLRDTAEAYLAKAQYGPALSCLAGLREAVDRFFDEVMVNADDSALRNNRLNLLKSLRELFLEVADISLLAVAR